MIIAIWGLPKLGVKKGGGIHVAKDGAHLKNMKLYVERGPKLVLVQLMQLVSV